MKLSIVIAVLDSHEAVRRQILYFEKLNLPETVEIVFVDDGSRPALCNTVPLRNFHLLATQDFRKWTQGLARMTGIAHATGEHVFCTDVDHIISREAIDYALRFTGDKAAFRRRFAYLDETGTLITDHAQVYEWGLDPRVVRDRHLSDGIHGNTWLMRRSVFGMIGGYDLERCNSGTHLQGEDREFNRRYVRAGIAGKVKSQEQGPHIYHFPVGRFHVRGDENPHGLFHNLYKEKWDR